MSSLIVEKRAVEKALDAIPGFAGSRIDSQLSDGPTNASYLLEQGGAQYVLRIDKLDAVKLGLNRSNEKQVCKIVADAGISPEPLYFDSVAGIYLRRYLSGRSWVVSDLDTPGNLERLARLLGALHRLPPAGDVFDPLAAATRYAKQLGSEQSRSILHRAEISMQQLTADPMSPALCHNDLVCQNVLESERLMLIDWEYAGIGDPYFDLAVVVQHHFLDERSAHGFLNAYLERPASPREIKHLQLQCDFYACLLELWKRVCCR
jgi:thiamine kinase-like enzyme